ncbi:MAG: hypothetical protein Q7T37_00590 [bacterium]|nr:hypothetical protein [bacterium]MDO8741913.1 hypothetical protein [bacterium]
MREEMRHSNFSKSVAIFLIVPIIFVSSVSFPRPAHAFFLVPMLISTILLAATTVVIIDATTCYINIIWGCSNANPDGTTTVVNVPNSATLTANPDTIDSGQSSNLTWTSTGTTACNSAGGFDTNGATSGGPVSTGVLTSTQNYQITCIGIGSNAVANASVTVLAPNVIIAASPDRVSTTGAGGATTISWNVSNVNSCTINKNGAVWKTFTTGPSRSAIGSAPDTINSQTTYTISCTNNTSSSAIAGSATKIVNIISAFQEF